MSTETYSLKNLIHDMHVDGGVPNGVCIRYVWSWTFNRVPCTRAVKTGRRHGYLDGHFPSRGMAAMNLTDKGREFAAQIVKARAAKGEA